jgi:hypothetical protein
MLIFCFAKRDYVDFCYTKQNKTKIVIFCSAKQQNSNETAVSLVFFFCSAKQQNSNEIAISLVFFRIPWNIYFRKIKSLLGVYRHNYVICAMVIIRNQSL